MRIFITGASGFIGSNLIGQLLTCGHELLASDILPPKSNSPTAKAPFRKIDLLDFPLLQQTINEFQPEVVFHLGARTDMLGTSVSEYPANILGVKNLVTICKNLPNLRKAVFASSRLVFEISTPPTDEWNYSATTPYGKSKVEGERIVRESGTDWPWVIVRPTSIWGPWFGIPYRNFFDHIRSGRYLHPKGESIRKSFGFVGNAVHELIAIANSNAAHRPLFLADYSPIEVLDFSTQIAKSFGVKPPREIPVSVMQVGAKVGDILKLLGMKHPPLTSFRLDNIRTNMIYDLSATEQIANDLPYSIEDGIRLTVEWILNNP